MIKMRPELLENLDTPEGLRTSLQTAIELEHATIPAYLYAMYSIVPGWNTSISNLILSVVMEEMLHMALACNLLNAIGGAPCIDEPGFIPAYPGPLPGSIEEGLIVPLAPFSKELVKNVFMQIEEPEHPLNFRVEDSTPNAPITIGSFYNAIATKIEESGEGIFRNPSNSQVTSPFFPQLIAVNSVESAKTAIETIVEQGEGTSTSPMDPDAEPAHYYRYAEIYHGKKLLPNPKLPPNPKPDDMYIYSDELIPFNPNGVYPAIENPKADNYLVNTPARNACNTFNYTYTSLLKVLHATFNGNPNQLNTAIGMMESLQEQAVALMAIDLGNGQTAGPSFEYRPTNP